MLNFLIIFLYIIKKQLKVNIQKIAIFVSGQIRIIIFLKFSCYAISTSIYKKCKGLAKIINNLKI